MTKPLRPGFYVVTVAGGFTVPIIIDAEGEVWQGTRVDLAFKYMVDKATAIEPEEFIDLLPEHKVQRLEEPKAQADAAKPTEAVDHVTPLLPYLRHLAESDDTDVGIGLDVIDLKWPYPDDTHFKSASAIRQSMYIGKLAEKRDGRLYLTEAGRALVK